MTVVMIDVDTMDERMAYEFYLKLKKRFEIKVDCKIFNNSNYVGNCQCKSKSNGLKTLDISICEVVSNTERC